MLEFSLVWLPIGYAGFPTSNGSGRSFEKVRLLFRKTYHFRLKLRFGVVQVRGRLRNRTENPFTIHNKYV